MGNWFDDGWSHIWHPYSQMKTAQVPLKVARTEGCRIILEDGRELIDGTSSWWSACHGYSHPHIVEAIKKQAAEMPHVMFGGLAHEQAYKLASRLSSISPGKLPRVFFSDSGSVAVEVAMKMAVQYWHNKGNIHRNKFIAFHNGYHGDTMGGMSLTDPDNGISHKLFNRYMPKQFVTTLPQDEYGFAEFDDLLSGVGREVAGLVIEPLVQAAGGMIFHSADVLGEIHRLCKKHNVLFIADEIATGFGRTGDMFACSEAAITPDILCVGKALTGGHIGLAATLASSEIFDAFYSENPEHAFMHGPTFMANPLACAAANASLDLFEKEPRMTQVAAIEAQLRSELTPLRKHAKVADVRIKGAIGVVEMESINYQQLQNLRAKSAEFGVWIRPFGNIIYLMPPFIATEAEISALCTGVAALVATL